MASDISLARIAADLSVSWLMDAMRNKPGPYPDPNVPIARWQLAHEHLLAARELLAPAAMVDIRRPDDVTLTCPVEDCKVRLTLGAGWRDVLERETGRRELKCSVHDTLMIESASLSM